MILLEITTKLTNKKTKNKIMKKLKDPSKLVLMAFSAGEEAVEDSTVFQKYIGVAPVTVVALNPTKEELEKLLGRTLKNDIEYFNKDANNKPQIRLDFWVKADPNWGKQLDIPLQKVTFFLSESVRVNNDKTKVQVIDKYGNTGWVTKEEFQNKIVPDNFKRLTNTYRECYSGEEKLIDFIKKWLNIPENSVYKNNTWEFISDMSKCEAEFKNIKSIIKGDIKDLQSLVKKYNSYKVKVCFGIKTTEENKKFQTIYTGLFLKNSSGNYEMFDKTIKGEKDRGALSNMEYSSEPLKIYDVEPTTFVNTKETFPVPASNLPDISAEYTTSVEESETPTQIIKEDDLPF